MAYKEQKGKVLILGATSDIAAACAAQLAKEGRGLVLAARNREENERIATDLRIRFKAKVETADFDALKTESHKEFWKEHSTGVDTVICAVGFLGDQQKARHDPEYADLIIRSNLNGVVSILGIIADDFEKKRSGNITVISSVAGDRGRASNYVYGCAKAGLSAYLSGLRQRLYQAGVNVLTVKPGFVATKMNEGMDLPKALTSSPEKAARMILKAIKSRKGEIYVTQLWCLIMLIIKIFPDYVFNKFMGKL